MSKESVKKSIWNKKFIISLLVVLLVIPGTLVAAWRFGGRNYYMSSLLLIIYSMVPFFVSFERRKPQARELVTIAVMSAIAVASRAAFIMLPFFKPMSGIIMITGMAFGPEAGFLTGAISAFVSNFIFGQGPWTPWQMFAYGVAGFLAGILCKKGLISAKERLVTAIFGAITVLVIVGSILDTCTFFTVGTGMSTPSVLAVYMAGLPVNAVHAAATFLTLFLLERPMLEKLDRIKVKYGMMDGEEDAV